MIGELACEVTEYMDKFRDPKQIPESELNWLKTYIMSGPDNKPKIGEYSDPKDKEKYYFWWVRIPGYTCANIIFNRKDDTVYDIVLTRRGGGYSGGEETMYVNPDKLEKDLIKEFKGKKLNCYVMKG